MNVLYQLDIELKTKMYLTERDGDRDGLKVGSVCGDRDGLQDGLYVGLVTGDLEG